MEVTIAHVGASDFTVTLTPTEFTYDGTPKVPFISVEVEGVALIESIDYTYTITDNINAGTVTVTITGSGDYAGEKSENFVIHPFAPTITLENKMAAYTGSEVTIDPAVIVGVSETDKPSAPVVYTYYMDSGCNT